MRTARKRIRQTSGPRGPQTEDKIMTKKHNGETSLIASRSAAEGRAAGITAIGDINAAVNSLRDSCAHDPIALAAAVGVVLRHLVGDAGESHQQDIAAILRRYRANAMTPAIASAGGATALGRLLGISRGRIKDIQSRRGTSRASRQAA
jgi:hypothetical protein